MDSQEQRIKEQRDINESVILLNVDKQKYIAFIEDLKTRSKSTGISNSELLILYLGRDALKIIKISAWTIALYADILVWENFKDDENISRQDKKTMKIIEELTEFLFIKSFSDDVERQINKIKVGAITDE